MMIPPEKQIQLMDNAQIDKTVIFTSTIHPETATTIQEIEKELNKLYEIINGVKNPLQERINAMEELTKVIKEHPGRYIGFGSIPIGLSYSENLDWIEKYIIANGFCGIGELTPSSGQVPQMEDLFRASQECGNLPLWVHTFSPLKFEDIKNLLLLAKSCPSVPVIIGHMGGVYWLDTLKAIREIPNTYVDLSASFTTMAPSLAIREYPERTLFGSDAPYFSPAIAKMIIEQLVTDQYVLEQILGGNIARLLNF
jgi:predicted TIM-barrel fold metal-dependent hydrolase